MPYNIQKVKPQFKILCRQYGFAFEEKKEETQYLLTSSGMIDGYKVFFQSCCLYPRSEAGCESMAIWKNSFVWFCKNPANIKLTVYPEGLWCTIRKIFGMQDLKTHNDNFDEHFIIQSNNELFVILGFTNEICKDLQDVEIFGGMGTLEISGGEVRYSESDNLLLNLDHRNRFNRLIGVGKALAERVSDFKPTKK